MKHARLVPLALLASLALLQGACSRAESAGFPDARPASPATHPAVAAAAPVAPQPAGALPRLVFFMNPHGQPCQIQDRILQEMAPELRGKVQVVYLRTTVANDIAGFQHYGIRSLPALILTDATGRELRRATPGIQPADQIRRLVLE
jgi:thioredoxin 1